MSDPNNPWSRDLPSPRPRTFVLLAFIVGVGAFVWLLIWWFPGMVQTQADRLQLLYFAGILVLLGSGFVLSRRFTLRETFRNLSIWIGIAAFLGVAFLYQDVVSNVAARFRGELLPSEPLTLDARNVEITESEGGNFLTTGEVNGVRVRFAVDTGASDVVLSPEDAERIGVDTSSLHFNQQTETANGLGRSAAITVRSLSVGPITFRDVPVAVNQAPMNTSLLGMAFLRRMKSFEFRGRKLYLRAN
jgi:aspartyl protease family protein